MTATPKPRVISVDDVVDSLGGTEPTRLPPLSSVVSSLGRLAAQGPAVGREASRLGKELVRVAVGVSEVEPARGDQRFKDPAWQGNPVYRRLAQAYLASCSAVDNLTENLDAEQYPQAQTAKLIAGIVTSALAPTNFFYGNPTAMKKAFDTGGASVVKGLSNWADDLRHNGGMPSTVKAGAFTVGVDLAVTPGAVITRDPVGELIQYRPTTEEVFARPTLIIPPPISRFYFLDLAPKRSLVEYTVSRGLQTFMLSWRNPTKKQADWDIDVYVRRIRAAIEEVKAATGQDQVNLIGFCAGGILSSIALTTLTAENDTSVHSVSFAVTLLDWGGDNPINAFNANSVLNFASWNSRRKGLIEASTMGSAFTWLRPNDLVWNYWVNNYLLGQDPPAFDILSWNADGTSLPAELHIQFLDIFHNNPLPEPHARTYLGVPFDLSTVTIPTFVMGGVTDHLTPWKGTYRTTQLIGSSDVTYVLSNAGHIASLVNPPDNPKASYFTGPRAGEVDALTWREDAQRQSGSWWTAWADWCSPRSGEKIPAPTTLGGDAFGELAPAPGLYVRDKLPA